MKLSITFEISDEKEENLNIFCDIIDILLKGDYEKCNLYVLQ